MSKDKLRTLSAWRAKEVAESRESAERKILDYLRHGSEPEEALELVEKRPVRAPLKRKETNS